MFRSYFKVAWRNLFRSTGYSLINVCGLAIGMTVATFIGLWIHDEVSFNKYHKNHDAIAQVWNGGTDPLTGEMWGGYALQFPVGATLENNYPQYFKNVLMAWWINKYTISSAEEKFSRDGLFIEPEALEMLSLEMLQGSYRSLEKQNSIVISRSMAEAIFGQDDPMNRTLHIDNRMDVEVTGVFEDIPTNSTFGSVQFFSTWSLWLASNDWVRNAAADWDNRMTNTYVQLQPNTTFEEVNKAIEDLFYKSVPKDFFATIEKYKPFVQVVPMNTWHLHSEFENGKPAGGRITFVWLFGIVGAFVLLLACINFINLSTARSEKRAKEVGIRKTNGSTRHQLIMQFMSESFMVVALAFGLSVLMLTSLLPMFNVVAGKAIALPFAIPAFWFLQVVFILFTGFMAGIYPAFFLSSFQPVKVLKGVFQAGRSGSLPRKILVVLQFTVSVILVIGTLIVYQQIEHARNRPIGYNRSGLISLELNDPGYKGKLHALRTELLASGVVSDAATSSAPLTAQWNTTGGYTWPGKDPNMESEFANTNVTYEFGKTIGWEVIAGRDFSREYATDSIDAIIINEAASKYMALKNPVGERFTDVDEFGNPKWSKVIIGVVRDVVVASPYEPVMQTIYYNDDDAYNVLHFRIAPSVSASVALPRIKAVLEEVVPSAIFDYKFVDQEFATKFSQEERVGQLAAIFSVLAIFISCLGLFGLASFIAEQRTKEIGIRKVMGASIFNLWRMLSRDFVVLVMVSCVVAMPVSYLLMTSWLGKYEYRTEVSWWIFLASCLAAITLTLLTVSYQSIKAAMMNPVQSLRSE